MKIAYIISAYKYPDQLIRLIGRLQDEQASFFVHIDQKTDANMYEYVCSRLRKFRNVYILKRYKCYWGDFGHVLATIEGMKEILRQNITCDYVVLLTGQDYPIASNRTIRKFFQDNKGKLFIRYFPIPENNSWTNERGGLDRIEYRHVRLGNHCFRLTEKNIIHFGNQITALPLSRFYSFVGQKRNLPKGYKPYGGMSYWCLTTESVEYIYNFIQVNKEFLKFFKYVYIPDEIIFQTILLNSHFKESIVNNSLRYMKWVPQKAHPEILGKNDFAEMVNSGRLFARKFDLTRDAEILDTIDQEIFNKA